MFGNVYHGKRVLITGHTGFKGSWLSQWLLDLGADVAGYALEAPSDPSHFETLGLSSRMRSTIGDILDQKSLEKAFADFQPEIVFHLAAQALVRLSYDQPGLTFVTNLMGTVNVLDAIRATPSVRTAVIITSDECYENVEWEFGYRETDRLGGQDPYSASKACAEIAFSSYARSFFTSASSARLASARAGNVIGGGDWAKDRIIPDCVRAWARGESPVIRNPRSTRPWQHVLEPLSGYLWLGAQLWQSMSTEPAQPLQGEAFNFGPPTNVTQPVSDLIEEMRKTWSASTWKLDPNAGAQKKEAGLLKLSCDKALHRLQWEPNLEFPETVAMTARWYSGYYEDPASAPRTTSSQIAQYQDIAARRGRIWAR